MLVCRDCVICDSCMLTSANPPLPTCLCRCPMPSPTPCSLLQLLCLPCLCLCPSPCFPLYSPFLNFFLTCFCLCPPCHNPHLAPPTLPSFAFLFLPVPLPHPPFLCLLFPCSLPSFSLPPLPFFFLSLALSLSSLAPITPFSLLHLSFLCFTPFFFTFLPAPHSILPISTYLPLPPLPLPLSSLPPPTPTISHRPFLFSLSSPSFSLPQLPAFFHSLTHSLFSLPPNTPCSLLHPPCFFLPSYTSLPLSSPFSLLPL